ncbi:MAG TPA: dephospho-CoA kinase [Acidimicrobiales bacterium]|jgi:dephospho-CoA kinase
MILIGLTGGIGSGKSTVSARLADLGARVIDADAITREVQQPGTEVFAAIVERFGDGIVADGGTLDRAALAAIVFADPDELKALNDIVHPAVGVEIAERMAEAAGTDDVVVLDVPLLVESGRSDMAAMVVVDLDPDVAVHRLVEHRGFTEEDARARISRQASREDRLAKADRVLDNSGSVEDLLAQVDAAWPWIQAQTPVPAPE